MVSIMFIQTHSRMRLSLHVGVIQTGLVANARQNLLVSIRRYRPERPPNGGNCGTKVKGLDGLS